METLRPVVAKPDLDSRDKTLTIYYVYLLKSTVNKRLYIGKSSDLKERVKRHNDGLVKSSKAYRPWVLVYYEAYRAPKDTSKRERQLKLHAAKNALKEQLMYSLD